MIEERQFFRELPPVFPPYPLVLEAAHELFKVQRRLPVRALSQEEKPRSSPA